MSLRMVERRPLPPGRPLRLRAGASQGHDLRRSSLLDDLVVQAHHPARHRRAVRVGRRRGPRGLRRRDPQRRAVRRAARQDHHRSGRLRGGAGAQRVRRLPLRHGLRPRRQPRHRRERQLLVRRERSGRHRDVRPRRRHGARHRRQERRQSRRRPPRLRHAARSRRSLRPRARAQALAARARSRTGGARGISAASSIPTSSPGSSSTASRPTSSPARAARGAALRGGHLPRRGPAPARREQRPRLATIRTPDHHER